MKGSLSALAPPRAASASSSSSSRSGSSSFFPLSSTPTSTPKPPSSFYYTARPSLQSTLTSLNTTLTTTRSHLFRSGLLPSVSTPLTALSSEFSTALPHPRNKRWRDAGDMSTYLKNGSQLRSSQYKKLTAVLGHLEGLLPYAQLADDLALPGARPPRVETDPVANSLNLSHNALTTPEGNDDAIDSLRAQLEDLLAKFQTPAIVSATGVTVERVSGKDRRLGKKDEFGRVYAVGRRKESTAQVWIIPTPPSASPDDAVPGQVLVNARPLPDYFGTLPHREVVVRPLVLTSALGSFNVFAIVKGGGSAAQADAVAMGMARALAEWARCEEEEGRFTSTTEHWRDWLNAAKLLKRDPRVVERKKTGQPKARKKNTWVKR